MLYRTVIVIIVMSVVLMKLMSYIRLEGSFALRNAMLLYSLTDLNNLLSKKNIFNYF